MEAVNKASENKQATDSGKPALICMQTINCDYVEKYMMRMQFIYSAKAISSSKATKEFAQAAYHNAGPGHGGLGPPGSSLHPYGTV